MTCTRALRRPGLIVLLLILAGTPCLPPTAAGHDNPMPESVIIQANHYKGFAIQSGSGLIGLRVSASTELDVLVFAPEWFAAFQRVIEEGRQVEVPTEASFYNVRLLNEPVRLDAGREYILVFDNTYYAGDRYQGAAGGSDVGVSSDWPDLIVLDAGLPVLMDALTFRANGYPLPVLEGVGFRSISLWFALLGLACFVVSLRAGGFQFLSLLAFGLLGAAAFEAQYHPGWSWVGWALVPFAVATPFLIARGTRFPFRIATASFSSIFLGIFLGYVVAAYVSMHESLVHSARYDGNYFALGKGSTASVFVVVPVAALLCSMGAAILLARHRLHISASIDEAAGSVRIEVHNRGLWSIRDIRLSVWAAGAGRLAFDQFLAFELARRESIGHTVPLPSPSDHLLVGAVGRRVRTSVVLLKPTGGLA